MIRYIFLFGLFILCITGIRAQNAKFSTNHILSTGITNNSSILNRNLGQMFGIDLGYLFSANFSSNFSVETGAGYLPTMVYTTHYPLRTNQPTAVGFPPLPDEYFEYTGLNLYHFAQVPLFLKWKVSKFHFIDFGIKLIVPIVQHAPRTIDKTGNLKIGKPNLFAPHYIFQIGYRYQLEKNQFFRINLGYDFNSISSSRYFPAKRSGIYSFINFGFQYMYYFN